MSDFDPQIWIEARDRLPLRALLSLLGDGLYAEKGAECPFCAARKGKWGLFKRGSDQREFFKCHNPDCVANDPEHGHSEIGYLVLRRGLPQKEAAAEYLRLAVPERVPHLFADPQRTVQPGEKPPLPEPLPRDGETKNPWHSLGKKLLLNAEDHRKLREKRGFSDETIKLHGLRSNNPTNLDRLLALEEEFSVSDLLAEGIYKEEGRSRPSPSGQFYGWGITGEKDDHGDPIFAQTEPTIIPYFDAHGIPFYLRPHKGGVKKPKPELDGIEIFEDADDGKTCASHVFVPVGFAELVAQNDGLAVFTEGEFKAIAGVQCGLPIFSCPGISFIRNPRFREQLEGVIERCGITELVIIFDNEVKDDPAFPGRYKPDPEDQWDTQVYAEYTMRVLKPRFARIRGSVRVGNLPDEHRIEGKADFSSVCRM